MGDKALLGRDAILAARADRRSEVITVNGLGSIRVMTPDTFGSLFINKHRDMPDSLGAAFIAVVVDENGNNEFELTDEEAAAAMKLPGDIVLAVVNAAYALRGAEIEEEIKNSKASPTTVSRTGSARKRKSR